jgi:formylglycine-generating enzyme required for sulfatase activity
MKLSKVMALENILGVAAVQAEIDPEGARQEVSYAVSAYRRLQLGTAEDEGISLGQAVLEMPLLDASFVQKLVLSLEALGEGGLAIKVQVEYLRQKEEQARIEAERQELLRQQREEEEAQRRLEAEHNALVVDLGNGVNLELVSIQAGRFTMGDDNGADNEKPAHRVNISPFLMGKYPVTQKQWEAVSKLPKVSIDLQAKPSHFKGDDHPVESISWHEAAEFCARLAKKTNRDFRLPSEAEWEYACRAGSTTSYSFGNSDSQLENYAWYRNNSNSQTHPVGKKKPNVWGFYDMHGNVWEWCADAWHSDYNSAPSNGKEWLNGDGSYRLLRGGSWGDDARLCRSACRRWYHPNLRSPFGFRLACSLPSPRT